MFGKNFWRCEVCDDVHYGVLWPETCPSCHTKNKFLFSVKKDAKKLMGFRGAGKSEISGTYKK